MQKKNPKKQASSMRHRFYKVQFLENLLFNQLQNAVYLILYLNCLNKKVTMDCFLSQKEDSFCLIKLKSFLLLTSE